MRKTTSASCMIMVKVDYAEAIGIALIRAMQTQNNIGLLYHPGAGLSISPQPIRAMQQRSEVSYMITGLSRIMVKWYRLAADPMRSATLI